MKDIVLVRDSNQVRTKALNQISHQENIRGKEKWKRIKEEKKADEKKTVYEEKTYGLYIISFTGGSVLVDFFMFMVKY